MPANPTNPDAALVERVAKAIHAAHPRFAHWDDAALMHDVYMAEARAAIAAMREGEAPSVQERAEAMAAAEPAHLAEALNEIACLRQSIQGRASDTHLAEEMAEIAERALGTLLAPTPASVSADAVEGATDTVVGAVGAVIAMSQECRALVRESVRGALRAIGRGQRT